MILWGARLARAARLARYRGGHMSQGGDNIISIVLPCYRVVAQQRTGLPYPSLLHDTVGCPARTGGAAS